MMWKFILLVYGPLCSGKTSLIKELMDQLPWLFNISIDKTRRLLSDFQTIDYKDCINTIHESYLRIASDYHLSVVIDGSAALQSEWGFFYRLLAEKYNYRFVEINIEAPYRILEQRFVERTQRLLSQWAKLKAVHIEDMQNRYESYIKNKNNEIMTFDSSLYSPLELCGKVIELLLE